MLGAKHSTRAQRRAFVVTVEATGLKVACRAVELSMNVTDSPLVLRMG